MIGWGPEREALIRLAPSNVEIGDRQTGAEYAATLARSRILRCPRRAETFGLALAEAMRSGCAVISSVPLEFAGARVRAGDRSALIREIGSLWNAPEECDRMGRQNIRLASGYTWDRYTEALLDTYRAILTGPSPTALGGVAACR